MKLENIIKAIKYAERVKTIKHGPTVVHHLIDELNPSSSIEEYFELIVTKKSETKSYKSENFELNQNITSFKFDEFPNLKKLELGNWLNWLDYKTNTCIQILTRNVIDSTKFLQITISFEPDLHKWNKAFTFHDYCHTFMNNCIANKISMPFFTVSVSKEESLKIVTKVDLKDSTINENIFEIKNKIKFIHDQTIIKIEKEALKNTILTFFIFPKEIQIVCEQYLLYFAQFLRDLGIDATSNLKEEAGKVLFSVTPTDDKTALEKIREALAVYLNLPASPIVYDDSFAAMRLQQQIRNLHHAQQMTVTELRSTQYALQLAQQTIENQAELLIHQKTINEQQNKIIEKISSKSIMMDSVENKEELEEIYVGLKIGESKFLKEQLGIHLNPAKVIKTAVKNTFGKDDEKRSVLGLDEEKEN